MKRNLPMILATFVVWACHLLYVNTWAHWLAVVSFALFFTYWALANKVVVVKYFQLLVMSAFWLAGVLVCECSEIDLWEIGDVAGFVGSFPLAALYLIVVLLVVSVADKMFKPLAMVGDVEAGGVVSVLGWMVLISGVAMFAYVFKRPSFLLGLDRFAYNAALPQVIVRGRNVLQCVLPVVVVMVLLSGWPRTRKMFFAGAIVCPFVFFNIWTGYKFDIFFFLLVDVGCPIILLKFFRQGKLNVPCWKLMLSAGAVVGLLALILAVQFKSYESEEVGAKFAQRISQQGQLWWKIFYLFEGEAHLGEIAQELDAQASRIGQKNQDVEFEPYGIYRLMELTTPTRVYEDKLSSGSRYTSRGLELPYYYFGEVGVLVFAILSAVGYVLLMNGYLISLAGKRVVAAILFLKILTTFNRACSMGELNLLFAKDTCFYLALLVFVSILRKAGLSQKTKV